MGIAYLAFKTRNVKPHSGSEEIIGRTAKVIKIDSINLKEGLVEFDGESWNFKSQVSLEVGDLVKVLEINGLTLKVERKKE